MIPDLKLGQKGHVELHKNIRNRVLNVLDYPSIQTAIDAAKLAGRSSVYLPDGTYNIVNTIQCAPGVNLILAHGAVLKAAADVDIVMPAPCGGIRGGYIDCTLPGFSRSAILIDGDRKFYLMPTAIGDVQILGNKTGTAVHFQARQAADVSPCVYGVTVENFGIVNFSRGIWMEAQGNGERYATINANQFSNGYISNCEDFIYMSCLGADKLSTNGNMFMNIQIQADEAAKRAIYCDGNRNMFSNFVVWDWHLSKELAVIELTSKSSRNVIYGILPPESIIDVGLDNRVV